MVMQMSLERGSVCRAVVFLTIVALASLLPASQAQRAIRTSQSGSFTLEQIKSYPFPNELTASATGARIAWAFNERGARNVWVAEGPNFKARRLTNYEMDDGQELTSLSVSADGKYVVYVRGGDHGSNFDSAVAVNPAMSATQMKVQIWSVPFAGGEPKLLGEGDEPVISPKSDKGRLREGSRHLVRAAGRLDTSQTFLLRTRRLRRA